jgi:hypothetical protein
MEYYLAIKNEIISFIGKWMELEIILLSKISQTQKGKYHILSYGYSILNKKGPTTDKWIKKMR